MLSLDLIQFDETETQFEHYGGRFVNFNKTFLVIGGEKSGTVEKLNGTTWNENERMSPINELIMLAHFSVLSIGADLYIFG